MRRSDLKGMTRLQKLDYLATKGGGENDCWGWGGTCDTQGYATFYDPDSRRTKRAHRLSYEMRVGPIPPGLLIRHTCDNPPCTNPHHLLPGTQKQNIEDAIQRGRMNWVGIQGERHPKAVLAERDVYRMRELRARGATYGELCREFPAAHYQTIAAICQGKTWRHLLPAPS